MLEREKGVKPRVIALQIGRPASTVYTVLAQKDAIMMQWKSGSFPEEDALQLLPISSS